jgi:hypothetical protein
MPVTHLSSVTSLYLLISLRCGRLFSEITNGPFQSYTQQHHVMLLLGLMHRVRENK